MPVEIKLPKLGETMQEAVVIEYKVRTGDQVKKGDVVFEVETDKATVEIESPADGFVKCILAEIDQTIKVGQPVLILGGKDEKVPQSLIDSLRAAGPAQPVVQHAFSDSSADDEPAALAAPPAPASSRTIPLSRGQKITARKMLQSMREIPCFYLSVRADVTDLVELRTKLNQTSEPRISFNDFIMRAVALGLEKFPLMTGSLAGGSILLPESINIAFAVDIDNNVVAPVVRNVERKNLKNLAHESQALTEKARNNKLRPADLEGACITVSNLGALGIESFIPIVIPGQCSILGIGKIVDTCLPDESIPHPDPQHIVVRKLMTLTLSVDHRIANGSYAAQFLDFTRKLLEDPANL